MTIRMKTVHTSIKLNDGQLFNKDNTCHVYLLILFQYGVVLTIVLLTLCVGFGVSFIFRDEVSYVLSRMFVKMVTSCPSLLSHFEGNQNVS